MLEFTVDIKEAKILVNLLNLFPLARVDMKLKDDLQIVWSEFQTNTARFISCVQENHDFSDVTLACDDDELVQAHRVIISAGSSFFETIFRKTGLYLCFY